MIRTLVLVLTAAIGVASYMHRTRWLELATARGEGLWDPHVLAALTWAGAAMGLWLAGLACSRLPEDLDVAHVRARGLVWVAATLTACAVWAAFLPWAMDGIHWAVSDWGRAVEGSLMALVVFPAGALMSVPLPWIAQALSRSPGRPGAAFGRVLASVLGGVSIAALAPEPLAEAGLGLTGGVWWVSILQLFTAAGFAVLGLLADWRTPRQTASPEIDRRGPTFGVVATGAAAAVYGYGLSLLGSLVHRIGVLALGGGPLAEAVLIAALAGGLSIGAASLARVHDRLRRQLPVTLLFAAALLVAYHPLAPDAGYWVHYLRVIFVDEAASYIPFHLAVGLCVYVLLLPLAIALGSVPASLVACFERDDWAAGRRVATVLAWIAFGASLGSVGGGPLWLPALGLEGTLTGCALLLAGAGALASALRIGRSRTVGLATAALVAGLALAMPTWSFERLALGLSAQRRALPASFEGPEIFFERTVPERNRPLRFSGEDLSRSVAVAQLAARRRALVVNGDIETALPEQEAVLTLLALLPVWLADSPQRALVIGAGSGLVPRLIGAVPGIEDVEVVEGSSAVLAAHGAFEDLLPELPDTVRLRLGDPRRRLQRSPRRYDVIVVSPRAWWKQDAVRLLDREALGHARDRLAPGGVYAHWIPRWGNDERVFRRFLATMRRSFDAVSLWKARKSHWIVIGFARPDDGRRPGHYAMTALAQSYSEPAIGKPLWRQRIRSLGELLAHEYIPVGVVGRVRLPAPIRVTDQPRIRRLAARGFFAGDRVDPPPSVDRPVALVASRNSLLHQYRQWRGSALGDRERAAINGALCEIDASACAADLVAWMREAPDSEPMRDAWGQARYDGDLDGLRMDIINSLVMPDAARARTPSYVNAVKSREHFRRHYSHAAPLDPALLLDLWQRCAKQDPRCAEQLESVIDLGVPWGS